MAATSPDDPDTARATTDPAAPQQPPAPAKSTEQPTPPAEQAEQAEPAEQPEAGKPSKPDKQPEPGTQSKQSKPAKPAKAAKSASPARRSRRFPTFTRDTARPEGGGRVVGGDAPAPYRQWPILTVLGGVTLGLLLTLVEARIGILLVGAFLLLAVALRWFMPSVGMLAVRSRFTDLVTYGVLGTAIVLLALMAQPDPWLELPFLEEIIRFTVR
ncbi:DUF3017 domain-containing protein [Streptomyces sp. XM4193]|uniref:DUF3017 domain-containing protein n=1 Tax=Streptomyces sp. XM4193 TaxID=2929782 RepID=UPI001FF9114F|nr:DUF3017 domain-containing protein [Streptomyces sp. XM4193]MCK1795539.1 DUF3017 domain-containing protein [Streptomyces sp. XM4193]